ncbi:hypothetical protein [Bacillus cereus]|nr:hypothetical protein [Bacillus cereus]
MFSVPAYADYTNALPSIRNKVGDGMGIIVPIITVKEYQKKKNM